VTKKELSKRLDITVYPVPQIEKNILPRQSCPAFTPRNGALPCDRECWFCIHADFQIGLSSMRDVGVCKYKVVKEK